MFRIPNFVINFFFLKRNFFFTQVTIAKRNKTKLRKFRLQKRKEFAAGKRKDTLTRVKHVSIIFIYLFNFTTLNRVQLSEQVFSHQYY